MVRFWSPIPLKKQKKQPIFHVRSLDGSWILKFHKYSRLQTLDSPVCLRRTGKTTARKTPIETRTPNVLWTCPENAPKIWMTSAYPARLTPDWGPIQSIQAEYAVLRDPFEFCIGYCRIRNNGGFPYTTEELRQNTRKTRKSPYYLQVCRITLKRKNGDRILMWSIRAFDDQRKKTKTINWLKDYNYHQLQRTRGARTQTNRRTD